MRKNLLVISLLFFATLVSSSLSAQNAKTAKKLLEAGDIIAATSVYEKLIEKNPDNPEYQMYLGECYVRTPQKNSYAIPTLEKAVSLYKDKSEKGYIDSKFLLGMAFHMNHKFDEAINTYNELVINNAYKKYRDVDLLQNEIRACEAAIEEFKKKKVIKIESPGNGINTDLTQHSPFFIESEGIFVYTSKEKTTFNDAKSADGEYDENVFFILIDNENDKEPDPYSAPLNSKDNEANCWVSKDGRTMLLNKDGDIYICGKEGSSWSEPEKFKPVNSGSNESHASMNDDQNICYFASDRAGGMGGKDIYYVSKEGGSNWSKPALLDKTINTKFDEESPFIHEDGTLYFSSKGHNSIGGYDIFSAKGSSGPNFSNAENLGMPVNSVEDDVFYYITSDNRRAFFMSKRPEGKGRGDIFMINYTDSSLYYQTVRGTAESENFMDDLSIFSVTSESLLNKSKTDEFGDFTYKAKRGDNYFVLLESGEHYFEAFTFSSPYNEEKVQNLGTKKLDKIDLANVHKVYSLEFDDETSELNNENHLFLDAFYNFISTNPDFAVNISANKNTDETLAEDRKQKVIDYLKAKGISEDKIKKDFLTYENNEDLFVSVIDKNMSPDVSDVPDDIPDDIPDDNNDPIIENNQVEGNFTIQLGAFERNLSVSHRFFKAFKGKVTRRAGPDDYYHYTIGSYATEAEAENELRSIQAKGFHDAFVRDIEWYR